MNSTSPLIVIDGSAVVALLSDAGPAGDWVTAVVAGAALAAPHLVCFEAANIFRRHAAAGLLDQTQATLAHADLVELPIDLWPYAAVAERAWQLRHNLTIYDASYIALGEMLSAPVVTVDARLARAPGIRCPVLAYDPSSS